MSKATQYRNLYNAYPYTSIAKCYRVPLALLDSPVPTIAQHVYNNMSAKRKQALHNSPLLHDLTPMQLLICLINEALMFLPA